MNFHTTIQPKGLNMPYADRSMPDVSYDYNPGESQPYDTRGVSDNYSEERSALVDAERERVHQREERLRGGQFNRKRV